MADMKISALTPATNLTGAIIPIVQGGTNKQAAATLFDAAGAATAAVTAHETAYNHANFLTAETDPVFLAWDKSTGISITESQISDFKAYELADPTILKSAALGVSVQPYDATLLNAADIDDASTATNKLWSAAKLAATFAAPHTTPNIVAALTVPADHSYLVLDHLTVTDTLDVAGSVGVL